MKKTSLVISITLILLLITCNMAAAFECTTPEDTKVGCGAGEHLWGYGRRANGDYYAYSGVIVNYRGKNLDNYSYGQVYGRVYTYSGPFYFNEYREAEDSFGAVAWSPEKGGLTGVDVVYFRGHVKCNHCYNPLLGIGEELFLKEVK